MSSMPAMSHLGKYRLDNILGQGAMGVVYKGFDEDIERPVAIKVLHSHLLDEDMGEELAVRFRLEAKAAARCMHSNIVTVFDYGVISDTHYIVMEYIEGIDLKSLMRQEKQLPFRQASDTVFQVLNALEHAHTKGVVHRDIKPANIMILDNGQVKVADFGIARLLSSDLTQAGFVIGTPGYMSPEGRLGAVVDNRSDLYSVGVVYYEILTGKRFQSQIPDSATLRGELGAAIQEEEVAERIREILENVLQNDQTLRFENAADFSHALGSILSPDRKHTPDIEEISSTVLQSGRTSLEGLQQTFGQSLSSPELSSQISPSVISQVEGVLTGYVGPMASLLVKKYAKQCSDIDSLLEALATHIPKAVEQTQFRSSLNVSSLTSAVDTSRGSGAARKEVLSEVELKQISSLLAQYIGPLASRIVKRAQSKALDRSDLCSRIVANIPVENEKLEFLQKLQEILKGG
ncbi:MAG: serine/threonine protein kinase [Gammaproteobacteria bacterium]|nr:serine/threonine protein kinase [Gammaproteobacteria bacterium]